MTFLLQVKRKMCANGDTLVFSVVCCFCVLLGLNRWAEKAFAHPACLVVLVTAIQGACGGGYGCSVPTDIRCLLFRCQASGEVPPLNRWAEKAPAHPTAYLVVLVATKLGAAV
jgi:hypothetical protein